MECRKLKSKCVLHSCQESLYIYTALNEDANEKERGGGRERRERDVLAMTQCKT